MGRFLSALLILLLAISHGSMSAAAPHFDGVGHEHVLSADHDDDHDAPELAKASDQAKPGQHAGEDDAGKAANGIGHHVHVVTDGVPTSSVAFLDRWYKRDRQLPVNDMLPPSATIAPPAEPPSA